MPEKGQLNATKEILTFCYQQSLSIRYCGAYNFNTRGQATDPMCSYDTEQTVVHIVDVYTQARFNGGLLAIHHNDDNPCNWLSSGTNLQLVRHELEESDQLFCIIYIYVTICPSSDFISGSLSEKSLSSFHCLHKNWSILNVHNNKATQANYTSFIEAILFNTLNNTKWISYQINTKTV